MAQKFSIGQKYLYKFKIKIKIKNKNHPLVRPQLVLAMISPSRCRDFPMNIILRSTRIDEGSPLIKQSSGRLHHFFFFFFWC
jgi:hypothetical protein